MRSVEINARTHQDHHDPNQPAEPIEAREGVESPAPGTTQPDRPQADLVIATGSTVPSWLRCNHLDTIGGLGRRFWLGRWRRARRLPLVTTMSEISTRLVATGIT